MPSERRFTPWLPTMGGGKSSYAALAFTPPSLPPRPNAKRLVRCSTRARIAYARPSHNSQAPKIFAYAHAVAETRNACNNTPKHHRISAIHGSTGACARAHTHWLAPANRGVNCRVSPIQRASAGKIRLFRHFRAAAEQPSLLSRARECTHNAQRGALCFFGLLLRLNFYLSRRQASLSRKTHAYYARETTPLSGLRRNKALAPRFFAPHALSQAHNARVRYRAARRRKDLCALFRVHIFARALTRTLTYVHIFLL